tara:strand:- start:350 stop:688 length:339 start_codon:yes stop_codon:yes gene_type:complete
LIVTFEIRNLFRLEARKGTGTTNPNNGIRGKKSVCEREMSAFTKAMGGGDPTVQAAVAQDVNRYMENAVEELGEKYARGQGGKDKSVDGPTGHAYKEEAEKKLKAKQQVHCV